MSDQPPTVIDLSLVLKSPPGAIVGVSRWTLNMP